MSILMIFIDGFGLGSDDSLKNPCARQGLHHLPCIEHGDGPVHRDDGGVLVPTEATLGVEGLPQSATGQTTILTGVNCSQLLGRHLQGYPNERLRDVLREYSILKSVKGMGRRATFINAYRPLFFKLKEKTKWRLSTTTVANLSAELPFFKIEDIRQERSIYHDFTNESLIARGFDVPCFSANDAARILARVSKAHDFVLYEYFLTDRIGHTQDMNRAIDQIEKLERFISALLNEVDLDESLIILTSDHGNIEDLSVKTHTRNRVMTLLWGRGANELKDTIRSLEDISPAILKFLERK